VSKVTTDKLPPPRTDTINERAMSSINYN
jgi:hypothetical protein